MTNLFKVLSDIEKELRKRNIILFEENSANHMQFKKNESDEKRGICLSPRLMCEHYIGQKELTKRFSVPNQNELNKLYLITGEYSKGSLALISELVTNNNFQNAGAFSHNKYASEILKAPHHIKPNMGILFKSKNPEALESMLEIISADTKKYEQKDDKLNSENLELLSEGLNTKIMTLEKLSELAEYLPVMITYRMPNYNDDKIQLTFGFYTLISQSYERKEISEDNTNKVHFKNKINREVDVFFPPKKFVLDCLKIYESIVNQPLDVQKRLWSYHNDASLVPAVHLDNINPFYQVKKK